MLAEAAALTRTNASPQGFSRAFGRAARDARVIEHASVMGSVAPAMPVRSIVNSVAYLDASDLPRVLPMLTREYESSGITA